MPHVERNTTIMAYLATLAEMIEFAEKHHQYVVAAKLDEARDALDAVWTKLRY